MIIIITIKKTLFAAKIASKSVHPFRSYSATNIHRQGPTYRLKPDIDSG